MPASRILNRRTADLPVPPRRLVHLGVGAFHRAHQAWYTDRLNTLSRPDDQWGIAEFTGRSPRAAAELRAQDGLYTLITRGPDRDRAALLAGISSAHDGTDRAAWLDALSDPGVAALTLTVTESGYGPITTERIFAALRARVAAGAGRLVVISCDNRADNSAQLGRAVLARAEQFDPGLAAAIEAGTEFASCVVDRITPATTPEARTVAAELTGYTDAIPVVTEPFSEWIIAARPGPNWPRWDLVGARFVADVAPYEQRKLRLLNGAHSLLAYTGLLRGRPTVADALADPACAELLEQYWDEARVSVSLPAGEIDDYLAALRLRFANPRLNHRLEQIAADGVAKLGQRIVPLARAQRERDARIAPATTAVLAAFAQWRGQPLAATLGELGL